MGVKLVGAPDTTQDYGELTDVKRRTQPIAAQTQEKVAPHEPPWFREGKKKKITAGQQMLGRDLRMFLSGLEVNRPGWYLFM